MEHTIQGLIKKRGEIGIFEIGALLVGAVLAFWALNLLANLVGAAIVVFVIIRSRAKTKALQSTRIVGSPTSEA